VNNFDKRQLIVAHHLLAKKISHGSMSKGSFGGGNATREVDGRLLKFPYTAVTA
jgi:hypothetical protein